MSHRTKFIALWELDRAGTEEGWDLGLCIEYRALNKITVQNRYPIPQINDLLDQLKGVKYFSKIDLNSRYHQVPIETSAVWKTAFKAEEGLFEWLFMPFGLMNALTTLMRLMDDILQPFTN